MPFNVFILELNKEKVHIYLSGSQLLSPLSPKLSIVLSNYLILDPLSSIS